MNKRIDLVLTIYIQTTAEFFDCQAKQTKLIASLLNTLTFKAVLVGSEGNRWCVEPAANLLWK